MKNAKGPSVVAAPMSIPSVCRAATTQDAAASPSVAVRAAAVGAVRVLVIARESRFFDEPLQAAEGFIPPFGNLIEIGSRRFHFFRLQLPDALAAMPQV